MKAKSILVAAVGFSLAVARVAVNATERPTTPPLGGASVFQDATNIVFRQSLGLETNTLGPEIPKQRFQGLIRV